MDTLKKCFKCKKEKDLTEFYKHNQMQDGYLNKCKICAKRDATEHRNKNLEKVRAYDKARSLLPHRVKNRKEYQKTYKSQYPERKPANNLLRSAIKSGKIKKTTMSKMWFYNSYSWTS